ncbi:RHS repeat domain-containing protein [Blastopirellula retiformator]
MIKETIYDDQGNVVKVIEYNFGHDEISQTVTEYTGGVPGTPTTHIFGHDGHGSVKVLYDAVAAIAQVYTYEAYGQMLAIHNAIAGVVGTTEAAALTTLLYSGEQFDSRIGQQYLRARYYDPSSGRFNRLDPFSGNAQDPQSFHKYLYAHGNPVMEIDPTGLFTISSILSGSSIQSSLRTQNAQVLHIFRQIDNVFSIIDTINTFREVMSLLSGSGDYAQYLRKLQNTINLTSSNQTRDWLKLKGLEQQHIHEVINAISVNIMTILGKIASEHRKLLSKVIAYSSTASKSRRPTIVVGLTSLPGDFKGSQMLSKKGIRLGSTGLNLSFAVSKNGKGGSLFSIGFILPYSKTRIVHSIFRVDYHGQKDPKETLDYGSPFKKMMHGHAYVLGSSNGIGPHIQGVGKPKFHYHIPDSRRRV